MLTSAEDARPRVGATSADQVADATVVVRGREVAFRIGCYQPIDLVQGAVLRARSQPTWAWVATQDDHAVGMASSLSLANLAEHLET